jgi:hypothetical protein
MIGSPKNSTTMKRRANQFDLLIFAGIDGRFNGQCQAGNYAD